jgi:hypothetical protein
MINSATVYNRAEFYIIEGFNSIPHLQQKMAYILSAMVQFKLNVGWSTKCWGDLSFRGSFLYFFPLPHWQFLIFYSFSSNFSLANI